MIAPRTVIAKTIRRIMTFIIDPSIVEELASCIKRRGSRCVREETHRSERKLYKVSSREMVSSRQVRTITVIEKGREAACQMSTFLTRRHDMKEFNNNIDEQVPTRVFAAQSDNWQVL